MGRHDLHAPPGGLHDEVNHVAGGREPLQALGGGRGQRRIVGCEDGAAGDEANRPGERDRSVE